MTQYRDFNPNTKVRVKTSKTKTTAAPKRRAGADSLQDVARRQTQWLKQPTRDGWWWWLENHNADPKPMLVVGASVSRPGEIATDEEMERDEYWEQTSTKDMPGLWQALPEPEPSNG